MQIIIDTENVSAKDAEFLRGLIGLGPVQNVLTGTAAQFLAPADNPANGGGSDAHLTNGAGMGQPAALNAIDANMAFGGSAPLVDPHAHSTAAVGQQQIAQGMGMPTGQGQQMPALGFNSQAGAQGGIMPQAGATTSNHAPNGTGVTLDKTGLPWDARIHSSTKEKNKDDTWRAKRNTDKNYIAQVEAELRGAMAAGANVQHQQVPATPQQFAQPQAQPQQFQQQQPQMQQAMPQQQQVQAQPQQFQQQVGIDFPTLSLEVANLQTAGKLQMPELFEIVGLFGLSAFHLLQQRPDLVPQVWAQIQLRTAGR